MVEQVDDISTQFFKAIYQLAGMTYDQSKFSQHSLEARSIVNQFVYEPLTAEQKKKIDNRSKTHRMHIPPPLDSMIDFNFVIDQVNTVLQQVVDGKSYDELNEIYNTGRPVSQAKFDELLSKVLNVKNN